MQEFRYDGSEKLTEEATLEKVEKALEDARNKTVALHKEGTTFTSKGQTYEVMKGGKLKRRAKNKAARKARRKNRK
jgi:hypothetical protein